MAVVRAQLFVTCLVDHFFPQVAEDVVKVLERLGVQVEVPAGQTCCGQPAFNGGFHNEARAMARHTLDVLSRSEAPVVVPSGSCADMLIHRYPQLLADDPVYARKAREVASRTYEFSQFLADVLGVTHLAARSEGSVVYHPSCHGLRGLGIKKQPVELLANVAGLQCRELPNDETCCGFGGLFAVKMSHISGEMLKGKLDSIEASGAEAVVGIDVSCLMHIGGGLRRRGSSVKVKHLAEVLAAGEAVEK